MRKGLEAFLMPSTPKGGKPAKRTAVKSGPLKRAHNQLPGRREAVIAALSECGNVQESCNAAGVSRQVFYDWVKDPDFAEQVASARESAADRLEQEARRRAHDGTEKPVYQGGRRVGTIREYSDTLLIFLLKGCRPEKYRERSDSLNVTIDYSKLTDAQLERIAKGESPLAVLRG